MIISFFGHSNFCESSDIIIAFIQHKSGGAYKAVRYAEKIGKAVNNLAVR